MKCLLLIQNIIPIRQKQYRRNNTKSNFYQEADAKCLLCTEMNREYTKTSKRVQQHTQNVRMLQIDALLSSVMMVTSVISLQHIHLHSLSLCTARTRTTCLCVVVMQLGLQNICVLHLSGNIFCDCYLRSFNYQVRLFLNREKMVF